MLNDSSCSIILKTQLSGIVAIKEISVQLQEGWMQEDEGGKKHHGALQGLRQHERIHSQLNDLA